MKVVHSFWARPVFPNGFDGNQLPNEDRQKLRTLFLFWSLSCLKLIEQHGEVELVTDDLGKRLLVDILELPYTSVSVELNSLSNMPADLWSLGKLHTYAMQDGPFIHVDGDILTWQNLTADKDADIIAQSPELGFSFYKTIIEHVASKCPVQPQGLFGSPPYNSLNSGVLGGTDTVIFKILYSKVLELIHANERTLSERELRVMNLLTDQYFFYNLVEGKRVSYVLNEMSEDYSECLRLNLAPHLCQYVHLLGKAKNDDRIRNFIGIIFEAEFPDRYSKFMDRIGCIVADQSGTSGNHTTDLIRSSIKANFLTWKNCAESSVYDLGFRLSSHASVDTEADRAILNYCCPLTGEPKAKELKGSGLLLAYLDEPASARAIASALGEDERKEGILNEILNVLTHYAFYYGAVDVVANENDDK